MSAVIATCARISFVTIILAASFGVLLAPNPALADAASDLQQQVLGTTPRLQVPIPGVDITKAVSTNDGITVPYLAQYIRGVYVFLISIVGVLAGVMIMVGGFQYLTAGGDKTRVDAGKEKITNAVAGLILALSSFVILTTINPNLTEFRMLDIRTVAQEPLTEFEDKDGPETPAAAGGLPMTDSRYDTIFQKYAPCAGVDWKVLKAIAYKESGLNASKVNRSGYIGLFQTKPANCQSALRGKAMAARCNDLTDPEVNTAVGAAMLKKAVGVISVRCSGAELTDKFTMLYINHNMGGAVLQFATGYGCDRIQLRNGCIDYYKNNGASTAKAYAEKYQASCLSGGKSAAECTGGPKFDYAAQTAGAMRQLGVTTLTAEGGTCPL